MPKIYYDFHIHSALSPCADDSMTPINIVATASANGLDAIAITDHNSIFNVEAAIEIGEALGVTVIPGVEVQTSEDIHILALFSEYFLLKTFFDTLVFQQIPNNTKIFGNQLIINSDDIVVGTWDNLLLTSSNQNCYSVLATIKNLGGVGVVCHINREENGMLAILGEIPYDLPTKLVEFSSIASQSFLTNYRFLPHLTNSDAHYLSSISSAVHTIESTDNSPTALIETLKSLAY